MCKILLRILHDATMRRAAETAHCFASLRGSADHPVQGTASAGPGRYGETAHVR